VSEYYGQRAEFVANRLNEIGTKYKIGILCRPGRPEATFYVWACFKSLQSNSSTVKYKVPISTDIELIDFLKNMVFKDDLYKCGIACVPGSAFLMQPEDKYVRFSCAKDSMEELKLAMNVLDRAIFLLAEAYVQ
jgi:aspartate/methionine/tyrosine aminotransferase